MTLQSNKVAYVIWKLTGQFQCKCCATAKVVQLQIAGWRNTAIAIDTGQTPGTCTEDSHGRL